MQRIAFQLQIRPGKIEEYEESHRHVWPELLAELASCGVADYSIFRRERQLFLYLRVPNFDALLRHLATSDVDKRWQESMSSILEPMSGLEPGEPLAMMKEVFFFEGANGPSVTKQVQP